MVSAQLFYVHQLLEAVLDVVHALLQLYPERYFRLAGAHSADVPQSDRGLLGDGYFVFLPVFRPLVLGLAERAN